MTVKILIVDDDPDVLNMTKVFLCQRQYEVITALNGLAALEEVRKQRPDLILLDVLMPEMDGYTLYKELKQTPLTGDIPVLIITGRGGMEDTFKVLGVDGFMTKPVLPEKLIEEIQRILCLADARRRILAGDLNGAQKKVLVVGFQSKILDSMRAYGVKAGCRVETSLSGAEAIATCVKYLPDIIFMDVMLDDISAQETLTILRRLPQFGLRPVIGYCYYETEELALPEARKKVLSIEESVKRFPAGSLTCYMGRYGHEIFLKTLSEYLKHGDQGP